MWERWSASLEGTGRSFVRSRPTVFVGMSSGLLLKEDAEILTKVFRVGLDDAGAAAATPRGEPNVDAYIALLELAEELAAEAQGQEDPLARWQDVGNRRSLIDRALVGRLSSHTSPAVDYLIRCFKRCSEVRSRKRDIAETSAELFDYVSQLCVSYAAMALDDPSMFPQPEDVEKEGVLRLLPYLKGERPYAGGPKGSGGRRGIGWRGEGRQKCAPAAGTC